MDAFLNINQRHQVGFEYVIDLMNVQSVFGQELINTQKPFLDKEKLMDEFNKIEKVQEYVIQKPLVFKEIEVYFSRFKNITNIVDGLKLLCLDEIEIFEVKRLVYNVIKMSEALKDVDNSFDDFKFFDFSKLFKYLDQDNSNMPFFNIYDEYSIKLKELRIKIKEFDKESSEHEELLMQIKDEEQAVKLTISQEIAGYQEQLAKTINQIGYLDLLIAKAKVANKFNLKKPEFSEKIILKDSYNPYAKSVVEKNGYNYIPLNIEIDKQVQLVTGSNMSGKSVTLKNIILNVLCFQYGFYPFAKEAKLPILDYVVYISDELQDLENSLSSFGKEIHVLSEALDFIDGKKGLIVLDEFARGTNPAEARMIVVGLCKYLNKIDAYAVLSTHLDLNLDIDYKHYQVNGLRNCTEQCLNSDDILRVMDYSLIEVDNNTKVPNDAFKVMSFLNVNEELKGIIADEYEKEKR